MNHSVKKENPGAKACFLCRGQAVFLLALVMAHVLLCITGCTDSQKADPNMVVITAGSVSINRGDFSRELEVKRSSYPYDIKNHPDEYNAMVLDLVSDMADEAVLLAAASAKGIDVSDSELEAAEAQFKKDYPEDSFDKLLLERAISYTVWKKSLKKDMVIQKLISQDLVEAQEIHPQDMLAYYDRIASGRTGEDGEDTTGSASGDMDEKDLVQQLRLEKSQKAFEQWLQGLKETYPVQINQQGVTAFLLNYE